jgi:solute carrier family 32 (vesicular inhibitory amino acid transporter)
MVWAAALTSLSRQGPPPTRTPVERGQIVRVCGTSTHMVGARADHVHLLLNAVAGAPDLNDTTLLIGALAVVLPTAWLPDLSALSYVGAAGLVSAVSMAGILIYYYFTLPHAATTDLLHIHSLPVTFGLLAFVFAGHAVFPTIYKNMRKHERPKFGRVLDLTYVITAAVCVSVGFCGYSMFGASTMEEVTVRFLPLGYYCAICCCCTSCLFKHYSVKTSKHSF